MLIIGQGDAQIGVCVMGKVRGRATNGPEDDLGFFYAGIAPAVRRGVAWRGVAWRGVAWRGVARRGVAWRGVAWG
ncbi:hypothetical protein ABIC33_005751 [Variovorax sp. 1140]|uniref:hypothetical protein n=1 Tax=Variovorax atrisoli TaxID=3394203 RepID=UPI00339288E6